MASGKYEKGKVNSEDRWAKVQGRKKENTANTDFHLIGMKDDPKLGIESLLDFTKKSMKEQKTNSRIHVN
jgi:hypothetical protein